MSTRLKVTYTVPIDTLDPLIGTTHSWSIGSTHLVTVSNDTSVGYPPQIFMRLWRWTSVRTAFTMIDEVTLFTGSVYDCNHSVDGSKALLHYVDTVDGLHKMQGVEVSTSGGFTTHAIFNTDRAEVVADGQFYDGSTYMPALVRNNGTWMSLFATQYWTDGMVIHPAYVNTFFGDMDGITQTAIGGKGAHDFGFGDPTLFSFHHTGPIEGATMDNDSLGVIIEGFFNDGVNPEIIWYAYCEIDYDGDFHIRNDGTNDTPMSGYIFEELRGGIRWYPVGGLPNLMQYPGGIRTPDVDINEGVVASNIFGHYVQGTVLADDLGGGHYHYRLDYNLREITTGNPVAGGVYFLDFPNIDLGDPTFPEAAYLLYSARTYHIEEFRSFISVISDSRPLIASGGKVPKLRQKQRDDVERVPYTRAGNPPTSRQGSIRQGNRNTYL